MARSLEELREYLVGEWLFQSDFKDSSGNGNHGTPTDIEWKPTARGMKPYANSDTSYIEVATPSSILDLTDIITISTWIKLEDSTEWQNFVQKYNIGPSEVNGYYILYRNDSLGFRFGVGDGVDHTYAQIGSAQVKGEWVHVVGTYDGSNAKIYINGVLANTGDLSQLSIGTPTEPLRMLGSSSSGNVDDVRIYNTALTDDEVLALYNSTKNAVGVRPAERSFTHRLQPEVDANTVAAFDMSTKNSDGTLMDLSW